MSELELCMGARLQQEPDFFARDPFPIFLVSTKSSAKLYSIVMNAGEVQVVSEVGCRFDDNSRIVRG